MEKQTVGREPKEYMLSTIYSEEVNVFSASALSAPAGTPLFWDSTTSAWEAFAATTSLVDKTERCAILMEAAELNTTAVKARVIVGGKVYKEFLRTAGVNETALPDDAFAALNTNVIFLDPEEV